MAVNMAMVKKLIKDLMNRLSYKGNWDNCEISGKGEMKYADGSTYTGFKDGEN